MWLGTSSIKGLFSPDTVTHLSAIVEGVSRSGGGIGSASASSYHAYTRQGKQSVHLASSCYYMHAIHATGKTHISYTSLSSYFYIRPHNTKYVLTLLYVCSRTTICVRIQLIPRQGSQIVHLTVFIPLYFCSHTIIYVP
jgi:hypothetical protein